MFHIFLFCAIAIWMLRRAWWGIFSPRWNGVAFLWHSRGNFHEYEYLHVCAACIWTASLFNEAFVRKIQQSHCFLWFVSYFVPILTVHRTLDPMPATGWCTAWLVACGYARNTDIYFPFFFYFFHFSFFIVLLEPSFYFICTMLQIRGQILLGLCGIKWGAFFLSSLLPFPPTFYRPLLLFHFRLSSTCPLSPVSAEITQSVNKINRTKCKWIHQSIEGIACLVSSGCKWLLLL